MSASLFAALIALVGIAATISGCDSSSPNTATAQSTSVATCENLLPNLAAFGITSCDYTTSNRSTSSAIPSPADTMLELVGSAVLSDAGATKLRADFEWESIRRDQIPAQLLPLVGTGQALTSREVNRSFTSNGTYAHGFVVLLSGEWQRLYFVARDLDHPIE